MQKKDYQSWNLENAFNKKMGSKSPPSYPNEMLVRILSSKKYSDLTHKFIDLKNKKVGEIGSFGSNNLRFFLDQGYQTYGYEINKDMIEMGKKNLLKFGYTNFNISKGTNKKIPIKNNFFDCFISINTIHYDYGQHLHKALKEFKRIIKKNGLVVIETIGSEHIVHKNSICKNEIEWIWKAGGFRNNSKIGLFYSKEHMKNVLLKYFKKVEVFERKEFMKLNMHFYFAVCLK